MDILKYLSVPTMLCDILPDIVSLRKSTILNLSDHLGLEKDVTIRNSSIDCNRNLIWSKKYTPRMYGGGSLNIPSNKFLINR